MMTGETAAEDSSPTISYQLSKQIPHLIFFKRSTMISFFFFLAKMQQFLIN